MFNLMNKILVKSTLILTSILLILGIFLIEVNPVLANNIIIKMGTDRGALAFEPSQFRVKSGDKIKWINNKLAPHNVIFDDEKVKSMSHPQLIFAPGDYFETVVPPNIKGEFDFYCQPHRGAGMVGKMIVD